MKFDHCLFGYDDGHRLIASSLPLGKESSLLTELSDLAPGTIFGDSDGYWTGLPVASLGRYALMRTWPAPEMSRPGCVWTHALLIEPSYLESIKDLSVLKSLVVRPLKSSNNELYRKKLEVDFSNTTPVTEQLNEEIVKKLILSLYGTVSSSIEIKVPGELDAPLFSVWSQQWPKLRRNFRFQTAAGYSVKKDNAIRFDATALLLSKEISSERKKEQSAEWLSVSVNDIYDGIEGSLRSFLWKYGCDVRRQRGSFKPLVEIEILDHSNQTNAKKNVVEIVSAFFPELNDAISLKQDLVNGELVQSAYTEIIKHILSPEYIETNSFPDPSNIGIAKLKKLWPSQADDALQIIRCTDSSEKEIAKIISDTLFETIKTKEFWPFTESYPDIRLRMVKNRPEFFFESEPYLDDDALIDLIPVIPLDATKLYEFIYALLKRNNSSLVDCVLKYFPETSLSAVIHGLNNYDESISVHWKKALIKYPELLLKSNVMQGISRVSLLVYLAKNLDLHSDKVFNSGVTPWYLALQCSDHDIQSDDLDILGCFLVVLACGHNDQYSPDTIESFYDHIHKRILATALSTNATKLLYPFLPDLGLLFNWDYGLRFRVFIAYTYIKYQWSPESFSSLSKSKKDRNMLAFSTSFLKGGNVYSEAIRK